MRTNAQLVVTLVERHLQNNAGAVSGERSGRESYIGVARKLNAALYAGGHIGNVNRNRAGVGHGQESVGVGHADGNGRA